MRKSLLVTVDVEEFLRGQALDAEEQQLWRTYAQHLLAVAGEEPLGPQHVEQAVQAVVDARRPPEIARLLQRVGAALLAHRRGREAAAPPPAAPSPAPTQPAAAAGLPPAPRSRVVPPPPASSGGSRAALYGLAALGVIALGGGVLWLLAGDDERPPWADRPDGAPPAASAAAAPSPAASGAGDIRKVNESSPGEAVAMDHVIERGKLTVVEFYSDLCPASRAMDRALNTLAARRPDLAIRQLNIDRVGAHRVDFASPLAQAHQVRATPSFLIFAASGQQIATGQQAKRMVRSWYDEVRAAQPGRYDPALLEQGY